MCFGHIEPLIRLPQEKNIHPGFWSWSDGPFSGVTTHRTKYFKEEENDKQICLNLDLLTERKELVSRKVVVYQ